MVETTKWEIRDCFDVWGNEQDGWDINDSYRVGEFDIPGEVIDNDKKLLEFVKAHTTLSTSDMRRIEVDGDCDVVMIKARKTQMPLFTLCRIYG